MKYLITLSLLILISCGSGKVVPTTDVCSLKKHYKDNVFQVLINGEPINQHYYTHQEAVDVTKLLARDNRCK